MTARRRGVLALLLTALLIGISAPTSAIAAPPGREEVGTYLVLLRGGGDPTGRAEQQIQRSGGTVVRVYQHAVTGYAAQMTAVQSRRLSRDPDVLSVEPDLWVGIAAQEIPTGLDRVSAPGTAGTAPALLVDGQDDVRVDSDVAILDTGIDGRHPDLDVVGYTDCTVAPCKDGVHLDPNGHGTHVAGTAAALDSGIGVVGVAPGARLWSVKVLGPTGSGFLSHIVAGLDWVTARADTLDVANLSLGCYCDSPALRSAVSRTVGARVTVVAAAGNNGVDAAGFQPASLPEVLAVSALADFDGIGGGTGAPTCRSDVDDTLADFSNRGAVVDLAAPGACIRSTWTGGGYAVLSGTSMAAPHVAGAAALLTSSAPFRGSPAAVRQALSDAGGRDWLDDSGDGVQEPLLDTSSLLPLMRAAAPAPQLSVGDAWMLEPEAGVQAVARVPVRLSAPPSAGVFVAVTARTADGSARAASGDYTATTQRLSFAPGEVLRHLDVPVHADTAQEDTEELRILLGDAPGATVVDATAVVRVLDDEGLPVLSVDDVTVVEPDSHEVSATATVRLDRDLPPGHVVTARVATADATARSGADFTAIQTTVTFRQGQLTAEVPVPVRADDAPELDEAFSVLLSGVTGAVVADSSAVVQLLDRRGPTAVSVSDSFAAESDPAGLVFSVTLSHPPGAGQTLSVKAATTAGSAKAAGDYETLSLVTLVFQPGEVAKKVVVGVVNDVVTEPEESLTLRLSAPAGLQIADAVGTGTIGDDDGRTPVPPRPGLSLADDRVLEPAHGQTALAEVRLALDAATTSDVAVDVATASYLTPGPVAIAGVDYVALPRTRMTIPAGERQVTVPVSILGNDRQDGNRSFVVVLTSPTGAVLADGTGVVTISDVAGPLRVMVSNTRVVEGEAGETSSGVVRLSLSRPVATGQTVSVQVTAVSGTARVGEDTAAFAPTRVTFAEGSTQAELVVPITGDAAHEGVESLTFTLSAPVGGIVADTTSSVVLLEHEGPLHASIADVELEEGNAGDHTGRVTVRLDAAPAAGQTVSLQLLGTTDETATSGSDHRGTSLWTLVFSEGMTELPVDVVVVGDSAVELDETFAIRLGKPTGLVLTDDRAVVTIHDDD